MSTRGFVGVMIGDVYRTVYVHFDCYLEGVGAELQDYTTQEAVEALIEPGDRSSLHGPYYKDQGEAYGDVAPVDYDHFEDFYEACDAAFGEWYYIFKDGMWYCGNTHKPTVLFSNPLYKTLTPYDEAVALYAKEVA